MITRLFQLTTNGNTHFMCSFHSQTERWFDRNSNNTANQECIIRIDDKKFKVSFIFSNTLKQQINKRMNEMMQIWIKKWNTLFSVVHLEFNCISSLWTAKMSENKPDDKPKESASQFNQPSKSQFTLGPSASNPLLAKPSNSQAIVNAG